MFQFQTSFKFRIDVGSQPIKQASALEAACQGNRNQAKSSSILQYVEKLRAQAKKTWQSQQLPGEKQHRHGWRGPVMANGREWHVFVMVLAWRLAVACCSSEKKNVWSGLHF